MNNYIFKIILVGDSNVGKSCILCRFINNIYKYEHDTTIGVDFGYKIINIIKNNNKIPIKIHIWDTAGQEYFRSIIRSFYRGAAGVVLVYDITLKESFNNINLWLQDINEYTSNYKPSIILVGNKIDLNNRVISYNEGLQIANEYNLLFIESSTLIPYNIDNIFINLINNIYDNNIHNHIINSSSDGILLSPIKLITNKTNKSWYNCC